MIDTVYNFVVANTTFFINVALVLISSAAIYVQLKQWRNWDNTRSYVYRLETEVESLRRENKGLLLTREQVDAFSSLLDVLDSDLKELVDANNTHLKLVHTFLEESKIIEKPKVKTKKSSTNKLPKKG